MRPGFIIGTALTAAVLTFVAAVVGVVVAEIQLSATAGILTRSGLVVVALALTAVIWRLRMRGGDRPGALLLGLMAGWLINIGNLSGSVFLGRLLSDSVPVAVVIDLALWALLAVVLSALLTRTSVLPQR